MIDVDKLIYETLGELDLDGVEERVFRNRAPEDTPEPFLVFSKSSGRPAYTLADESHRSFLYVVKVIDRGDDQASAAAIDSQVRSALTDAVDGATLESGATVINLRREGDVEYEEVERGVTYQHVGGTYRVHISL